MKYLVGLKTFVLLLSFCTFAFAQEINIKKELGKYYAIQEEAKLSAGGHGMGALISTVAGAATASVGGLEQSPLLQVTGYGLMMLGAGVGIRGTLKGYQYYIEQKDRAKYILRVNAIARLAQKNPELNLKQTKYNYSEMIKVFEFHPSVTDKLEKTKELGRIISEGMKLAEKKFKNDELLTENELKEVMGIHYSKENQALIKLGLLDRIFYFENEDSKKVQDSERKSERYLLDDKTEIDLEKVISR